LREVVAAAAITARLRIFAGTVLPARPLFCQRRSVDPSGAARCLPCPCVKARCGPQNNRTILQHLSARSSNCGAASAKRNRTGRNRRDGSEHSGTTGKTMLRARNPPSH